MKVKFMPIDKEFEIKPNQSVLDLAHENGVHIQSVCKGVPSCAECRIQIMEGEHNVFPPGKKEESLIGTAHFVDRSRLSCQLKCFGDLVIDLKQQIEKENNAKRPRGKFSKDPSKSNAVQGSILLEDPKAKPKVSQEDYNLRKAEKVFLEEELRLELERIKKRKETPKSTADEDADDEKNRNS
ncbi:MAG: 2Fe-2S iron-sulfur cluster-binding protein [Bdellovibrionota bacterium]